MYPNTRKLTIANGLGLAAVLPMLFSSLLNPRLCPCTGTFTLLENTPVACCQEPRVTEALDATQGVTQPNAPTHCDGCSDGCGEPNRCGAECYVIDQASPAKPHTCCTANSSSDISCSTQSCCTNNSKAQVALIALSASPWVVGLSTATLATANVRHPSAGMLPSTADHLSADVSGRFLRIRHCSWLK